jgi:predicted nucleotidyltransferase
MNSYDASTARDLQPVAMVLAEIDRRATACGVTIMVVGATARDILIRHVLGSRPLRATADLDVAVAVASWHDVECLTRNLPRAGRNVHKFLIGAAQVDIIPFGGVESDKRIITWPDDHRMDVLAFSESLAAAVHVKLPGEITVAVPSLPAQSLLKLFAWRDRRLQDRRDAIDLRAILDAYHTGKYLDELYSTHEHLLIKHDFDTALAGADRLGSEASAILGLHNVSAVTDLLFSDEQFDALTADMGSYVPANRLLLSAYRDGFL